MIVIEGPTGVGKTTVATVLATHAEAVSILDPYEHNPFIAHYYERRATAEWTPLLTEAVFLFLRVAQLRAVRDDMSAGVSEYVADYLVARTWLFGRLLADRRDGERLGAMADAWGADLPQADVVVWLKAAPETLLERVRTRNRSIDRGVTMAHLAELVKTYDSMFVSLVPAGAQLIEVDTESWDPRDDGAAAELWARIRSERSPR